MQELTPFQWAALIFCWVMGIVVIVKFMIPDWRSWWNEKKGAINEIAFYCLCRHSNTGFPVLSERLETRNAFGKREDQDRRNPHKRPLL